MSGSAYPAVQARRVGTTRKRRVEYEHTSATPLSPCLQHKNRQRWLSDGYREQAFAYMTGIAKNRGGFAIRVGGFYDHVHLLVRIPAKLSVSDFVGALKSNTSKHINDTSKVFQKLGWQDGFGAFTVSVSQKNKVVKYIENQMVHHSRLSFEDVYLDLLKKHEVEYDPKYVWD